MGTHGYSLRTTATPSAVWRLWSNVQTWPEWNPDVTAITLDGPFAAGTRGRMTTGRGGAHTIRLARVEPGRSFELETAPAPLATFVFRCDVQPEADGSRISQSVAMRGPLGWLYSMLMGRQMARAFETILRGLASRAEHQEV